MHTELYKDDVKHSKINKGHEHIQIQLGDRISLLQSCRLKHIGHAFSPSALNGSECSGSSFGYLALGNEIPVPIR
jgi:hypothetical protein